MVAEVLFAELLAIFIIGSSAFLTRTAWIHWFRPERARRVLLTKSSDPSLIRGHERGIVPFALAFDSLAVAILAASIGHGWTGTASVVITAILITGASGFLIFLILHGTVVWFNWPGLLVPPHLRDDVGTIPEWWRWRRDLRIALKEAAERAAPGQRSDR
jgi:hypothetical protein